MSYKVVRDAAGDLVSYGPNDDNYVPAIAEGNASTVENDVPTAGLAQAKTERIAVMKAAYGAALETGFTANSILMQADIGRLERLKAGYDLAILESEGTMDIIDQDNALHAGVAVATVLTMIRALGVNARTLLMQKNARRTSINAAANVAAVNAINWNP